MIYLPSLLKKIAEFQATAKTSYNLATIAQETFHMPDDDEAPDTDREPNTSGLYDELINAGNNISDGNLRPELFLIADLYKKAVEINGGYNFVKKAISNFINLLDNEDDPEQSHVEDLMNEVSSDLRKRIKDSGTAVTGDTEQSIAALKNVKSEFNNKEISEEMEAPDDLTMFDENAKGVFDLSGGVNKEVGQSKGRGYQSEKTRTFKDWEKSYDNERLRFVDEIAQIDRRKMEHGGLLSKRDKKTLSSMQDLVLTLQKLRDTTGEAIALEKQLQIAPSEEVNAQWKEAEDKIKELSKRRSILKQNIRTYELNGELSNLEEQSKNITDPKAKLLLEQKLLLQKLMLSNSRGKSEEYWLRKKLIESISDGRWLTEATLTKMLQDIDAAAARREEFNKNWTKNNSLTVKDKKNRGKTEGYLEGIALAFTQAIANMKHGLKQPIRNKIKSQIFSYPGFKSYVTKFEEAKGTPGEAAAKKDLDAAIYSYLDETPIITEYMDERKMLYNLRDAFVNLSKRVDAGSTDDNDKMVAAMILDDTQEVRRFFTSNETVILASQYKYLHEPLDNMIKALEKIAGKVSSASFVVDNSRIKLLTRILNAAEVDSNAAEDEDVKKLISDIIDSAYIPELDD